MTYRRRRQRIHPVGVHQGPAEGGLILAAVVRALCDAALSLRIRQRAVPVVKDGGLARRVSWQLSPTGRSVRRLFDEVCGHWRFEALGDPRLLIGTELVANVVEERGRSSGDGGVVGIAAGGEVMGRRSQAPWQVRRSPTCGSMTACWLGSRGDSVF